MPKDLFPGLLGEGLFREDWAMTTMAELRERANEALFAGAFNEALRLYGHIVELQPSNLYAR